MATRKLKNGTHVVVVRSEYVLIEQYDNDVDKVKQTLLLECREDIGELIEALIAARDLVKFETMKEVYADWGITDPEA